MVTLNSAANVEASHIEVSGLEEEIRLYSIKGRERLSENFQVEVQITSEHFLDVKELLEKPVLLRIGDDYEVNKRYLHGIIFKAVVEDPGTKYHIYRLSLCPRLQLLQYRSNQRIFQDKTAQDVIKAILEETQLTDFRFAIQGSLPKREYCVQYKESDLAFIQRLLSEEGLYYYFEHTPETHTLVITDGAGGVPPLAEPNSIPYHVPDGAVAEEYLVYPFFLKAQVQSGTVSMQDYEFKKPSLNLYTINEGEVSPYLEDYQYPGRYLSPEAGERLARLRLEQHQWQRRVGTGGSSHLGLETGRKFTLTDHPSSQANQDYLILGVALDIRQPIVLEQEAPLDIEPVARVDFEVIPAHVPFRPLGRAKPSIDSIQTAIVTGPEGEEIYTDEFGRIKVQFHWDREGKFNETSSCWLRVGQISSGASWGGLTLPRIGQEVVVSYENGDPDRPLVTGSVYHGENRPPYTLPDEKTKSTVKTNSSLGGDGFNELRFEDLAGEEQIFIHAQKDMDFRLKNDARSWIGNDEHTIVVANQMERVEGDKHIRVIKDRIEHVQGQSTLDVGKEMHEQVGKRTAVKAGQEIHVKAGAKLVVEAGRELTAKVGGNFVKLDAGGVTIQGSLVKINSGGSAGSGSGANPVNPMAAMDAFDSEPAPPPEFAPSPVDHTAFIIGLRDAALKGKPFVELPQGNVGGMGQTKFAAANEPGEEVEPQPAIGRLKWGQSEVPVGEEAEIKFTYVNFKGGEKAEIRIFETDSDGSRDLVDTIETTIPNDRGEITEKWIRTEEQVEADLKDDEDDIGPLRYRFEVEVSGQTQTSTSDLYLLTTLEVNIEASEDSTEEIDDSLILEMANGKKIEQKITGSMVVFEKVIVGPSKIYWKSDLGESD